MADERAVVVGAGGISTHWFPILMKEQVDVAGVVDLAVERAEQRVKEYGLDAVAGSDLKEMLDKCQPDFVIDLTVPEAHCSVTCTALEAGCDVIGEKPMAADMDQARKMIRVSEQTGKMYMVSQSRRWNAEHHTVRRTVVEGRIGQITNITCDFYIGAHFSGFRNEMPSPLIMDMAIHHFDMVRFMANVDPVAVYAREFNPKGSWYAGDAAASCIFEMSNGVVFTYSASWCAEGCQTSWNGHWRFVGEKGTLIYEKDQKPYGQVVAGDEFEDYSRKLKDLEPAESDLEFTDMHGALREMLEFLRTANMPQTECHDNIKSLAMVFAVIESSRQGKRVSIDAL